MPRNHFKTMTVTVLLALCALAGVMLGGISGTAHAATDTSATNITAELLSEQAQVRVGQESSIAIAMTPKAGWHGYWLNGGDAGFGMQVEWDLPPGVTVGPLAYPVPDTLVIAGLMNHVYERPYALLAPLKIAANIVPGTRLPIRAQARWLACTNEICVPESANLSLDLMVAAPASATPAPSAQFDRWRAAVPQPLGSPVRFMRDGQRLRIAVPVPATLAIPRPHLFVETARVIQPGGEQRFARDGDMVIIETAAGDDAPSTTSFPAVLRFADGRGLAFIVQPGPVPAATSAPFATTSARKPLPPAKVDSESADAGGGAAGFDSGLFLTALVGAIIGGLILNIMPCVFPILSLKALALAKAGGADNAAARTEGLAYTAGAVLTCMALGLVVMLLRAGGEAVGWAFQLQRPETVVLLVVLMTAITANLAGLFEFGTLSFSFGRPSISSASDRPPSPARNALATGALAAFVATPCSGPFLGSALGATLVLPLWAALPIFGGLGLGLALPFLALALFPALRRRLPKPGGWMVTLRRILAVPMAATPLGLVWVLGEQVGAIGWLVGGAVLGAVMLLGWLAGRSQRKGESASWAIFAMVALIVPASLLLPQPPPKPDPQPVAATEESENNAKSWLDVALENARSKGRSVFVYFTADWCVSCKVNEASSINRAETKAAFAKAGVITLVADWTSADPAITRELARHGRNSVPLYLWYPAGADGEPEILPQILTPSMLTERAAAAGPAR